MGTESEEDGGPGDGRWRWLQNSVNVLRAPELYT